MEPEEKKFSIVIERDENLWKPGNVIWFVNFEQSVAQDKYKEIENRSIYFAPEIFSSCENDYTNKKKVVIWRNLEGPDEAVVHWAPIIIKPRPVNIYLINIAWKGQLLMHSGLKLSRKPIEEKVV